MAHQHSCLTFAVMTLVTVKVHCSHNDQMIPRLSVTLKLQEVKTPVGNSEPSNQAERPAGNSGASTQGQGEEEELVANSGLPNMRMPMNENSTPRYRLQFQKELPALVYTLNNVKAKDGKDVEIAIFDTVQECIVTSAPLSSAKAEVVVLYDYDSGAIGQESWSREFGKHIVKDKVKDQEGNLELLLSVINLNQGVGRFKDIKFTNNPSGCASKKKFKLGLRMRQPANTEVREGVSSCFTLLDIRSKGNEKYHPPKPTDEVYRLKGIQKDGPIHKRLVANEISNVQKFLDAYRTNPDYLRGLLGSNGRRVAGSTWTKITEHACECHPGDERQQVSVENLENRTFQSPGVIPSSEPTVDQNPLPQQTFYGSTEEISSYTRRHSQLSDRLSSPPLYSNGSAYHEEHLDSLLLNFDQIMHEDSVQHSDIKQSFVGGCTASSSQLVP